MLDSIKMRLRLALLGVVVLFVGFALLSIYRMDFINQKSTEIETNWLPSIVAINAINKIASSLRIEESLHVMTTDEAEMVKRDKDIEGLLQKIAHWQAKYEPLISSAEEKTTYDKFVGEYNQYLEASKHALNLSRKNRNKEATDQLKISGVTFDQMSNHLAQVVEINNAGAAHASHEGDVAYAESFRLLVIIAIIVTGIALYLMRYFELLISIPLGQLTEIIQRLAKGQVDIVPVFQERKDEIGQTAKAVATIISTIKQLTEDSLEVIGAVQSGVLSARTEASKHQGEFGEMMKGVNKLLDILNKPLDEISQVMQNFAMGNLKISMVEAYQGDLQALKANVNRSLNALTSLFLELAQVTTSMTNRDLTKTITGSYQGEFAVLKNNVNNALAQFNTSLGVIVTDSRLIANGVTATTKMAQQVAEQSTQQMAAVVEMASAVNETTASIRMIAENTKRGNELASTTAQLADTGLQQLNKLVTVIEQISAEYSRIEQITGGITRIADKTHLLSLNAGLEAVRAGEHGLGFGFVAQQIGKLAEEASIAARDIGKLISGSMQNVHMSVTGSRETLTAMETIASAARESGMAVQTISVAMNQQSTAVEWLATKAQNVRASSEANTALAKDINKTMAHLAETVEHTGTQIRQFTLS